jgi:hypothetical protein
MASLVLEPAPDNDFGAADLRTGGINVRGIDDVHPGFSRLVEDPTAFGFVRLLSEGSAAEDQTGDRQARPAELLELHGDSLCHISAGTMKEQLKRSYYSERRGLNNSRIS